MLGAQLSFDCRLQVRFFLRAQTRLDFADALQMFLFCLSEAANLILLFILFLFLIKILMS